jgi:hypothetical protein
MPSVIVQLEGRAQALVPTAPPSISAANEAAEQRYDIRVHVAMNRWVFGPHSTILVCFIALCFQCCQNTFLTELGVE